MKQVFVMTVEFLAVVMGLWMLMNLVGDCLLRGFSADFIWINLRYLPSLSKWVLVAVLLTVRWWQRDKRMKWICGALIGLFMLEILYNCYGYYLLLNSGAIHSNFPFPFSFLLLIFFASVLWVAHFGSRLERKSLTWGEAGLVACLLASCCVGLVLAHILSFGSTDYRRQADCAIVFGAKVSRVGEPSRPVSERVNTAVELYQQGYVKILIMSGGTGVTGYNEAVAMQEMAIAAGVPASAILLDRDGNNTKQSMSNLKQIVATHKFKSVLAVSSYYHQARIKLLSQRLQIRVYTVPAETQLHYRYEIRSVLREIPAILYYYLTVHGAS